MITRLAIFLAISSVGAVAPLSVAQAGAALAVGPDAGGYLCPDGRQLYVKSCYNETADASCGVVLMHMPMQNGYQREAVETRRNIAASVAGCKQAPVGFSNGLVGLVAPPPGAVKPASPAPVSQPVPAPAKSPVADLDLSEIPTVLKDGVAIGDNRLGSSMVRVSPAGDVDRIVYVDEASRRKTANKTVVSIWSLATYPDNHRPFNTLSATWVQNQIDCKNATLERTLFFTMTRLQRVLSVSAESSGVVAATDETDKAIAGVACKRTRLGKAQRYNSVDAAMTAAANDAAPKVRLPATEAEKKFFAAIKGNLMQSAVNASLTNADGKPVPVVELKDDEGMTAVHWAAENGNMAAMRWLLDKGPGVNLKDKKGRTPLKIALDRKDARALELLLNLSSAEPALALPGHDDEIRPFEKTDDLVAFMLKTTSAQ